ncbi:hypothetical protein CFC21_043460 [Triticum aestivum]|uniref:MADS-box domain-containing protein n=2 Tax=Triticum aestivum TaxID=4565 RepID=A0A3B6FY35_WHEAT|nr:hypothetical protein CFC21_043460 [Triticum aestivum]
MPRGKTPTGLIENERRRGLSFKNRRRGLLDKADQLAVLCGVPVAVVCADPRGGEPTVVESEEGVLARYRALPAVRRVGHAHRGYLEGLLVKERTKLARVRQGGPDALAAPHAELGRMTLDELRELLGAVDAAMAAAAQRRRALGLQPTGDGGAVVETARVDSGPWIAGGSSSSEDGGYPMQQLQQQQGPGGAGLLELAMWHGGGMTMQPDGCSYGAMNAMQAAYSNPRHDAPLLDQAMMMVPRDYYHDAMNTTQWMQLQQPAYNQQRDAIGTGTGAHGMGGYQLPMPGNGGNYHGHGGFFPRYDGGNSSGYAGAMPDLTMWCPAEPCNASAMPGPSFTGNSNFSNLLPEFHGMGGAGGSGMNYYADGNETQGSSNELHCSGGSSLEDLLFGDDSDD